jgi:hypothetical protein
MAARGFFETVEHPVVGVALPTVPFRFASVERWLRSPAPTLGEHNREILQGWLGLSEAELESLAAAGIIGERPAGGVRAGNRERGTGNWELGTGSWEPGAGNRRRVSTAPREGRACRSGLPAFVGVRGVALE